ncbi:MAG: response regulator, partial [Flavobacteriales bacterium]|nr:response regulator [Flavobacteriales bacterium]
IFQEQLIEAKEKAESAAIIKSHFLANMSHEIRTPINGITGLANLLLKSKLTSKQQKYLNAILNSTDSLLVIIDDILDISKIEAGKMTIEKKKFEIRKAITNLMEEFNLKAIEKGLKFNLEIDDNVPNFVIGDIVRLNQILSNLLGNAIKFTSEGSIELTVKVIKTTKTKVNIEFEVTDTGIGISPSNLHSIFKAFTQVKENISSKYEGTGLGLSIVKKLLDLQKGNVSVQSELHEGSVFTFNICYKKSPSNLLEVPLIERNIPYDLVSLKNLNILIVEDNLINQIIAQDLLADQGCNVKIATNGEEAISMFLSHNFDIILMDIQMPIMNGYQAIEVIRSKIKQGQEKTPIIALTAFAIEGDKEKCIKLGADDYLSKPFNPNILFGKIARLTTGVQLMSPTKKGNLKKVSDFSNLVTITNGKVKLMVLTIKTLREEIPKDISLIKKTISTKDWNNLYKILHRTSPNFDLVLTQPLRNNLRIMQENAKAKINLDQIPKLFRQINNSVPKLLDDLNTELKKLTNGQ